VPPNMRGFLPLGRTMAHCAWTNLCGGDLRLLSSDLFGHLPSVEQHRRQETKNVSEHLATPFLEYAPNPEPRNRVGIYLLRAVAFATGTRKNGQREIEKSTVFKNCDRRRLGMCSE